jgi:hypothetical protein
MFDTDEPTASNTVDSRKLLTVGHGGEVSVGKQDAVAVEIEPRCIIVSRVPRDLVSMRPLFWDLNPKPSSTSTAFLKT